MAAVLACGDRVALSHESAAVLWGIRPDWHELPVVTIPMDRSLRRRGIVIHRSRTLRRGDVTSRDGISVTSVVRR
jgi:hypothetical protein